MNRAAHFIASYQSSTPVTKSDLPLRLTSLAKTVPSGRWLFHGLAFGARSG